MSGPISDPGESQEYIKRDNQQLSDAMSETNEALGIDQEALEQAREEIERERVERAAEWEKAKVWAKGWHELLRDALIVNDTKWIKLRSRELVKALDDLDTLERNQQP